MAMTDFAQQGPVGMPGATPDGMMQPQMPQGSMQPEMPEGLEQLVEASGHHNLAEVMDEARRNNIAHDVLHEYGIDKDSMHQWTTRMENGLDLARLIRKDKSTPWVGASNVRFPLVTSAALQFNARAYPAIVPGSDPVKCQVHGNDRDGAKAARSQRVSAHMSFQLMSEVAEWEMETDALLTVLPIVGTMLRKTWFDPTDGRTRIKLCEPAAIAINNKVASIENAPRISEEISLYPYEVEERRRSGAFLDVDLLAEDSDDTDAPMIFIEQHRRLDLDDDGYPEPYVVTVHKATQTTVRIVANFEPEDIVFEDRVISIKRRDYYSVYQFLPSMDGAFWGTGLGMLLGDISETINTTINLLIDSGALASLGGGFYSSQAFRMKGGAVRFKPGEWKPVNAAGSDIKNAFMALPHSEPSPVLFQMLGLLIDAGREIASVQDIMTGDAPRQQTATTTLALIEQGMEVFTAAYKRIYRALKEELAMMARINAETLNPQRYSAFHDEVDEQNQPVMFDPAQDYGLDDMDITPVADPRVVTSMQAMGRAQLLMEMSQTGSVDQQAATQRVLEVAHIEDVEELMPQPNPIEMEMEKANIAHMQAMREIELELGRADVALKIAKIQEAEAGAAKDYADADRDMITAGLTQARDRMQALQKMMESDDRRGPGNLAGQPGNGAAVGQPSQGGGAPQTPDLRSLLGGGGIPA